jgi:hypothetical protein
MSNAAVSFSLGLNIKKSNKKNRVVLRQKTTNNSPIDFAIKKLVGELKFFPISDDERNSYINFSRSIHNLSTMNMKYLAAALVWVFKYYNGNIPDFNIELFKNNPTTESILSKVAKNNPPIRSEYLQLATYITKIQITIRENLPPDEEIEQPIFDTSDKIDAQIDIDNDKYIVE